MPSLGSFGMRNVLVKKRYVNIDRFRVLIIGKTGCGKTTILEKFCGGKISDAPSETRGGHDIDKQLVSENNASFVAHDSCGFEAGQEDEFRRVLKFIERRENEKPTEQVHVIWYCVQANSRPIQAAEKMFFSTKHGSIPVVAVLTKFDTLINTCKQELMAQFDEDDDEMDDDVYDALEADAAMQAEIEAQDKFEKHYRKPLLAMPYPPSDVVKLSNVHKAADAVLSLRHLTAATWNSLRLSNFDAMMLFAVAQQTFVHSYHRETFTLQGAEHLTDAKLAEKRTKIFSLEDEVSLDQSSVKAIEAAMMEYVDNRPDSLFDRVREPVLRKKLHIAQVTVDSSIVAECLLRWKKNRRPLNDGLIEEICKAYRNSASASKVQSMLLASCQLSNPEQMWYIDLCTCHTQCLATFIDELRRIKWTGRSPGKLQKPEKDVPPTS